MSGFHRLSFAPICLGTALLLMVASAAAQDGGDEESPDGGNWATVTVTCVETVSAYRPQVRWVERVVSVAREVWEKVTTWVTKTVQEPVTHLVQKTVSKPVSSWVKRTSTRLERTGLGQLVKRVTTWHEKAVTWVRQTIWEKVTTWVKRTILEPADSWVKRAIVEPLVERIQESYMEPYTAYRVEEYSVWVPPVTETVPGHYETRMQRKEITTPILQEVATSRVELIDAGSLPAWAAQDFFGPTDSRLSADQQRRLFARWRDALGLFAAADSQQAYQDALNIFFGSFSADGQAVPAALAEGYGRGREPWSAYNPDPDVVQNLSLFEILGDGYPRTVHRNLCGELAVMAAMGLSLEDGLRLFAEVHTTRMIVETGEDGRQNITWSNISGKDLLTDVIESGGGSATTYWQLEHFFEQASGGGLAANYLSYPAGDPPEADDVAGMLAEGKSVVARVNIDTMDRGRLQEVDLSGNPAPHWVPITGVIPTQDGTKVVRVYNPYQNREELYSWDSFSSSWGNTDGNNGHYQLVVAEPAE